MGGPAGTGVRPAVIGAMRCCDACRYISAPLPSAFADLITSAMVEVIRRSLEIPHDGLQYVDSSYGPRALMYECRTGWGIAGSAEMSVLRRPSGRNTRVCISLASDVLVTF